MRAAIGLLALTLVGADRPTAPGPQQVSYQIRIVQLDSLDWRAEVYDKLVPVTHQGAATVWTAPKVAAETFLKWAQGRTATSVVACPTITALTDQPAHFSTKSGTNYVGEMGRMADGPVNHARAVAFVPKIEKTREGTSATVSGRKIDQGVLTRLVLEDARVESIHTVKLRESLESGSAKGKNEPVQYSIQVPEQSACEVAGEWLIPNDGVLVVSLGATTVKEKDGKAGVRERVALIEARSVEVQAVTGVLHGVIHPAVPAFPPGVVARTGFVGLPVPPVPQMTIGAVAMPAPAVPSRSLPVGVSAHGETISLPPLPVDLAPPTTLPGSSEPCATPQTRHHQHVVTEPVPEAPSRRTAVDVDSTRAVFEFDRQAGDSDKGDCCEGDDCCTEEEDCPADAPSAKGVALRFPLNRFVTIEVRATAGATAKPATPTASTLSNIKPSVR